MSPPVIVCAHDKRLDDSRAHGHSELIWKTEPGRHSVSALRFHGPSRRACPATFISAFSKGDMAASGQPSCLRVCDLSTIRSADGTRV
jgi:hypothetical protein